MAIEVLGWSFQRPWALSGLLLVALVVLLSLERRRSRSVPLGTAHLFSQQGAPSAAERRRWLSASRIAAIAALVAGTLALAAPHRPLEQPEGDVLVALIDRTPSMFLPIDAQRAAGARRVDAAVDACQEWALAREQERGVPVRIAWADVHAADPYGTATDSPDGWLAPPATPPVEPVWGVHDRDGVVWVTDRMPATRPLRAGVFASGGAEVPGLVAVDAGGGWVSTADGGAPLVRDPDAGVPRVVIGQGVPDEVATLARIWAEHRGLAASDAVDGLDAERDPGCVLLLHGPGDDDPEPDPASAAGRLEVGRDGWFATVGAVGALERASHAGEIDRVWLTDVPPPGAALRPLVIARAGELRIGFSEIDVAIDTAAEFAVSWSGLFDATRRLPLGVVSLEERAGAGRPGSVEPRPLDVSSGSTLLSTASGAIPGATADVVARLAEHDAAREARRVAAALAAAAAALGLVSAALRLRGSA